MNKRTHFIANTPAVADTLSLRACGPKIEGQPA